MQNSEVFTPIVGSALAPPIATPMTDGQIHLAYELMLTNAIGQTITFESLVVKGESGTPLLTLSGEGLKPWVRPTASPTPGLSIGGGQQAIVTIDVAIDAQSAVPTLLTHELVVAPEHPDAPMIDAHMTLALAPTRVSDAAPIVIGAPLRGANWFDANSCCRVTPHRSAVNPINGQQWAPERFAIDFVQLNADGKIFDGAIDDFANYAFYGADILAVGDGPIVSMGWDLPEVTPGANPSGLQLREYGGNFIVQDLGGGHYAFYAHLQGQNPKQVRVGQQLTRGEVIGFLGNSGNSSMPHLHFHIMDSPLPLGSNGLPFVIDRFTLAGSVSEANMEACSNGPVSCLVDRSGSAEMTNVSPRYLDVLDFRS